MSQSVAKLWYPVVLGSAGLTCQCLQHEKSRRFCKHVIAADAIIAKMWDKCRHARMTVLVCLMLHAVTADPRDTCATGIV